MAKKTFEVKAEIIYKIEFDTESDFIETDGASPEDYLDAILYDGVHKSALIGKGIEVLGAKCLNYQRADNVGGRLEW